MPTSEGVEADRDRWKVVAHQVGDELVLTTARLQAERERVAQARQWILNTVDPAAVGADVKQQMLDYLTPPVELLANRLKENADAAIVVDGSADPVIEKMLAAGWMWDEEHPTENVAGKRIRYLKAPPRPPMPEVVCGSLAFGKVDDGYAEHRCTKLRTEHNWMGEGRDHEGDHADATHGWPHGRHPKVYRLTEVAQPGVCGQCGHPINHHAGLWCDTCNGTCDELAEATG
jgi:hypothetical protein